MGTINVDEELFNRLMSAYNYDAASTVGWVKSELTLMHEEIDSGANIFVYEPSLEKVIKICSSNEFKSWACKHFPAAMPKSAFMNLKI